MEKRTTWAGLKIGTKFMVVSNSNSHNYPLNKVLTMARTGINASGMSAVAAEFHTGNVLNIADVKTLPLSLEDMIEEKKNIMAQMSKLHAEYNIVEEKLSFMNKSGIKHFDSDQFKVYRILEIADSTESTIKRTELILDILHTI